MAHDQNVSISQLRQAGSWDFLHQPQNNMQKFLNGKPKIWGVTQILIGLMKISLWAMWKTPFHSIYEYRYLFSLVFVSVYPVWGPLCFFVSGTMSIVAGRKLTMNLVRGSLATNIISAIISGVELALLTVDMNASIWNIRYLKAEYGNHTLRYEGVIFSQVFLVAILILTLLEICITLLLSAFGCMVACFVTQGHTMPGVFFCQGKPQTAEKYLELAKAEGSTKAFGTQAFSDHLSEATEIKRKPENFGKELDTVKLGYIF